MTDVRSMNRVLLAALLVITELTLKPASAQAPAAATGGSSSITNTTTDKPGATTTTTTTTTSGIPTSGDSSTVAGTDLAPTASAPATDEPTVPKIRGLANTGGEPALFSLAGMALASGALLLRRRLD